MSKRRGDSNTPKRIGSGYVNPKKNATKDLQGKLRKALEWFQTNGIRFNFSIKEGDRYIPYVAFINSYKESSKDPDFIVYPVANDGRPVNEDTRVSEIEDDGPPF